MATEKGPNVIARNRKANHAAGTLPTGHDGLAGTVASSSRDAKSSQSVTPKAPTKLRLAGQNQSSEKMTRARPRTSNFISS